MAGHEGRGIGLVEKLNTYKWQQQNPTKTTFDANVALGHEEDGRSYIEAANILKCFGITTVSLITNNRQKVDQLTETGIKIERTINLSIEPNPFNEKYLRDKSHFYNDTKVIKKQESIPSSNIITETETPTLFVKEILNAVRSALLCVAGP